MKKVKIDDFTNYKFLSNPKYSPDGLKAVFIQHQADIEENSYKSYLWLLDTEKNTYKKLTSSGSESTFFWKDNENIIFTSGRIKDEKFEGTRYFKISVNGGEAEEFMKIPIKVSDIKEISENKYILTGNYDRYMEGKNKDDEKDYNVLEEIPFWSNGSGFTSGKRNRLYIFDSEKNELTPVTDEYTSVGSFDIKGSKVIYTSVTYRDKMPLTDDVYIFNTENIKCEKLENISDFSVAKIVFYDENTLLAVASDMQKYGINENSKFYKYSLDSQKFTCITPELDISLWNSVGSDCRFGGGEQQKLKKDFLYFTTTQTKDSHLYRIDIEGNTEKIIINEGTVDSYDIYGENIIFAGFRGLNLQEIYTFSMDTQKETKITSFNSFIEDYSLSKPERLRIETDTDVFIDGWIMKPVNFEENKKYPVILDIHGGPKTVYGENFFHEMQYWANEGYAVIFCNPRGSDGRGNEFADIRGKYGTIDYDDIMKFTEFCTENYSFLDKDKIGVTGGSYGGFMTNWIIGHTDFFKAAASQRSISNWISKSMITDIGYYFVKDQQAGDPWENVDKLWFHSPLKYADKAKTPTLFIHSDEDLRCYMAEGFQMFSALKYHGTEAKLVLFHGETHELSRSGKPKHRIRRLKEITEWMDLYLK
ncbi:MAG: S9 family peptidase [Thermotogae bacterium]|nr:S9 family peptidase [Thermotogota bacterium]